MCRRLLLAALWLVAACGRFGFDFVEGNGSSSPDATGVPDDTGVPAVSCPAKPMGSGTLVTTANELVMATITASPGDTILLADGVYDIAGTLPISTPNLTIRSASNRADAAVIDGKGTANPILYLRAANISIISLTMRNTGADAIDIEPIDMAGDATGLRIYDVTFTDVRGPTVRAKSYASLANTAFADGGELACSRIGHTVVGDCGNDGVFGVRLQGVTDWVIRDNYISGQCAARVRGIWADQGARNITISGNVFANNSNNIILGGAALRTYADPLPTGCTGIPEFWGGEVCNNRFPGLGVAPIAGSQDFEEGIALWNACDTWVLHNTVVSPMGAETFENIEYRFPDSYVHLVNNLLTMDPLLRDGGRRDPASTNVLNTPSDFIDATAGDLHLAASSTVGLGAPISRCLVDASGATRNMGAPTPGAFER